MPIETILTRQLNIRFIDAKALCNEAKINLGIEGYHRDDQEEALLQEAINVFSERPDEARGVMRRLKSDLDAAKIPKGNSSHRSESEYDFCWE